MPPFLALAPHAPPAPSLAPKRYELANLLVRGSELLRRCGRQRWAKGESRGPRWAEWHAAEKRERGTHGGVSGACATLPCSWTAAGVLAPQPMARGTEHNLRAKGPVSGVTWTTARRELKACIA